jgi:integrase
MARVFSRVDAEGIRWWYADWREGRKRHRVKVGTSKTEARAWLERGQGKLQERKLLARVYGDEVREIEPIPFDKFCALYFARVSALKRNRRTEAVMFGVMVRFFGGAIPGGGDKWPVDLSESKAKDFAGQGPALTMVASEEIERFRAHLAAQARRPSTRNRYRSLLHHVFRKAVQWGFARRNPVADMVREKEENARTRVLSADEESRLFDGMDANGRPFLPEPARTVALFALHTGCRWGEIVGLRKENVDLDGERIIIPPSNAKAKKGRSIPLNAIALKLVADALAKGMGRKRVFCYDDGSEVKSIRTVFGKALENVKIFDFRFHDLRHTCGTRLVMSGADLNTVRDLLGHSSFAMTQRYLHTSDTAKRTAVELLVRKPDNVGTERTMGGKERKAETT